MFIPTGIGAVLAVVIFLAWDALRAVRRHEPWASREEYRRLPLACLGGPLFALSEFWLGGPGAVGDPAGRWHRPDLPGPQQLPHRRLRRLQRLGAGVERMHAQHAGERCHPAGHVPAVPASGHRLGLHAPGIPVPRAGADPVCLYPLGSGIEGAESVLSENGADPGGKRLLGSGAATLGGSSRGIWGGGEHGVQRVCSSQMEKDLVHVVQFELSVRVCIYISNVKSLSLLYKCCA